jgi:hypothetical protein
MKQKHLKSNSEHEKDLTQNLTILWATIMGQCTPALQEEVHGEPDYMSKCAAFDSVWLLQSLQKITAGVNKTTNKYYSVFKVTKKFYVTQQSPTEGIHEYYNRFENAKDLVGLFNYCRSHFASSRGAKVRNKGDRYAKVSCRFTHHERQQSQVGTSWRIISLLDRIHTRK